MGICVVLNFNIIITDLIDIHKQAPLHKGCTYTLLPLVTYDISIHKHPKKYGILSIFLIFSDLIGKGRISLVFICISSVFFLVEFPFVYWPFIFPLL